MPPSWTANLRHLSVAATVCALLFAGIGYFGPKVVDDALHYGILQNIVWRPDSPREVDARFRGYPRAADGVPDYFRVWMWNLTNVEQLRKGAKPHLVEVGPLTYVKSRVRLDPRWDRNGRVSVKEWDYHVFVPEFSSASPDDEIVTLNLPLLGVLEVLHAYSSSVPAVRPLLDVLVGVLSGWRDNHVNGLFTKRTAGELLWGYEDPLLQRLRMLLGPTIVTTSSHVALLKNQSAEEIRADKGLNVIDTGWRPAGREAQAAAAGTTSSAFDSMGGNALLGGRSYDENLQRSRRQEYEYDEQRIWNMELESGWAEVTSWGPNCSEPVRGTDAFQFQPSLDRNSVLRVWIAELFRSAELLPAADEELHGIQLLRFVPNPREAEPDPCYHQFIRGIANVTVPMAVGPNGNGTSAAAHGVPILMSLPRYCLADESVAAALNGTFSCDPLRHGIFLDVEPTTGITMRAAKRLQLSSQLTSSARATLEPSITASLILPIFWAEEAAEISATQAAVFRANVYRAQRISAAARAWSYPAAGAAAALALAAAAAAVRLAVTSCRPPRRRAGSAAAEGAVDGDSGAIVPTGPVGVTVVSPAAAPPPPPATAVLAIKDVSAAAAAAAAMPTGTDIVTPQHNVETGQQDLGS